MKRNVLKVAVIMVLISTIICSFIVSQDNCHLEICHDDDCVICAMIQIAQNIINLSIAVIVICLIGVLIYFFLSRLRKEKIFFEVISLVFLKVQFNE